jgi:hypothetical protein
MMPESAVPPVLHIHPEAAQESSAGIVDACSPIPL